MVRLLPLGNGTDNMSTSVTKRPQTVMWILKAARIAASDIYVFGVSAETSGRLSTSRLLCSEAIQAVSSKNGDIIHLSPETLGWDWRAHLGRPRQFCAPQPSMGLTR